MGTRNSTCSTARVRALAAFGSLRRPLPYAAGLMAGVRLLGAALAFAALPGAGVYSPPASGAFAYNSFVPALSAGVEYVDPCSDNR